MKELKRSWGWHVLIIGALVVALVFVVNAKGDYSYCGHGYISNGSVKDVYQSYYNAPSGHHHIYYTYLKLNGTWFYAHKHDRVC